MNFTPIPNLPLSWRFWLLAASFIACVLSLQAQSATGSLTGRVSDAATGKSLQGAIVKVLGTPALDYTDAEGRFSLPGLPVGTYRVEVDYVGLDSAIQEVTVAADRSATLAFGLKSEALRLEAFTVAEQARGQALAVNQQKTSSGIINIVSEETFGSMVGGNIGYALQRLPGLTVSEDEDGSPSGVNIRGLESKYNAFQIDGNRLPTSGNTRSFATGQLTADGISNIEVIKAPTPDRDGDALGGIINVTTRSAFEREGRSVRLTASGEYYDKNESWGHNVGVTYSDVLSLGRGENNLGVSLTATSYSISRDYDNLDKDYAYLRPQNEPALALSQPFYFHTNGTPQTNFRDTEAFGFNLSLDYRLHERATFYLRPFYSHNTVETEKPRTRYYINSNHNFNGATGTKSIAAATPNTGRSTANTLTEIRYQNEESTTDNDANGASFGGRHQLETLVFSYDGFLSTNESNRDRSLSYVIRNQGYQIAYDQSNRTEPVYIITNGKDPYDITAINRGDLTLAPRDASEQAFSLKGDVEKRFIGSEISGSFKAGLKYRENTKEQDQSSIVYRTGSNASGFPYASLLERSNYTAFGIPLLLQPDIGRTEALLRSSPSLFALQANDTLLNQVINDYQATEEIAAGYVMGTLKVGRTTVVAGLRAENNTFSSETYRYNSGTPSAPTRIRRERDYTVYLPGLHLRHELRKNLILRESYNRSYSRPDVDRLVAGLNLDTNTGNISGGNPDLKETTSHNFDVQLEYYTQRSGLYSVGLFYKDLKGFYYDSSVRFNTTDGDGFPIPAANGTYTFTTTQNAQGAENYGLELIARQGLYFLPGPLKGFAVSLSATFTESDGKYPGREAEKLPTYGFSDTIYYGALEYTAGNFRAQISYRYRSEYLEGLDVDNTFDDYFGATEAVDFESSYQVNQNLRLFLNINNLNDEPQVSYQGFGQTGNPEDTTRYGFRASLGANYTF